MGDRQRRWLAWVFAVLVGYGSLRTATEYLWEDLRTAGRNLPGILEGLATALLSPWFYRPAFIVGGIGLIALYFSSPRRPQARTGVGVDDFATSTVTKKDQVKAIPDPPSPVSETETEQVVPWRRVREYNALLREHPASEFNDTSGWLEQIGTTQDAQISGDKIDMRLVDDGRSVIGAVRCELSTPTDLYIADERQRQIDEGLIKEWQLPETKRDGGFVFPDDFKDTKGNPPPTEIAPGIYVATWFSYESYEPFEFHPRFLCKAAFRITADGQLQEELR